MKKHNLSYIAGLFDGDGSVSVGKTEETTGIYLRSGEHKEYHRTRYHVQASFSQKEETVLKWITSIIGFGNLTGMVTKERSRFNLSFRSRKDVRDLLILMVPFLKVKKLKAERAIKYCNLWLDKKGMNEDEFWKQELTLRTDVKMAYCEKYEKLCNLPASDMNKENIAYIAGLFDADGYIMLTNRSDSAGVLSKVAITNTWFPILYWTRDTLNYGNVYIRPSKPKGMNKNPANWYVYDRIIIKAFLQMILPYLHVKKEQAKLMIEFCGNPEKYPVASQEREDLILKMSELKGRASRR